MTATTPRSSAALVSLNQNTAPVIEYRCLFTHDLRRKQKRWQDGFLKFHTFNRRIMVYDVPRNFIGDSHFAHGQEPQEGDELELEKGCVLVQIADVVAKTDTDLTELLQSRERKSPHKAGLSSSPANMLSPMPNGAFSRSSNSRPSQQHQKHKSLNALLGTPKGRVGKAVLPTKSPFELRHDGQENERWEDGPSHKRRKTDGSTKEHKEKSAVTPGANSTRDTSHQKPEVIDLCSDGVTNTATETTEPSARTTTASSKRRSNIHNVTRPTDKPKRADRLTTGNTRPSETPVPAQSVQPSREESGVVEMEPSFRKGGSLRLASNAPRRMLVCQEQLSRRSNSQPRKLSDNGSIAPLQQPTEAPRQPPQRLPEEPDMPFRESVNKRIARKVRVLSSSPPSPPRQVPDQGHAPPRERPVSVGSPPHSIAESTQPSRPPSPPLIPEKPKSMSDSVLKPLSEAKAPARQPLRRAGDPVRRASRSVTPRIEEARPQAVPKIIQTIRANTSSAQAEPSKKDDPPTFAPNDKQMRPPRKQKGPQKNAPTLDLSKAANPLSTTMLGMPFKSPSKASTDAVVTVPDTDRGPWSKEALDLFVWRPPDWEERMKKSEEARAN